MQIGMVDLDRMGADKARRWMKDGHAEQGAPARAGVWK